MIFASVVIASFVRLQQSIKTAPIGTGYAGRAGIGAVGTVIVGGVLFGEELSSLRFMPIGLAVAGVLTLPLIEK